MIRYFPGGRTDVYVEPSELLQLYTALVIWKSSYEMVRAGELPPETNLNLSIRDGGKVIRFRIPEELDGINPDPSCYSTSMPNPNA